MGTIDHVTIRAGDRDSMVKFYDRVFDLLDFAGDRHAGDAGVEWGDFSLAEADAERAPTEGLHIAFTADSQELVDSWWRGLIDAGYRSDGEPDRDPRPPRLVRGVRTRWPRQQRRSRHSWPSARTRDGSDRPPLDPRSGTRADQALLRFDCACARPEGARPRRAFPPRRRSWQLHLHGRSPDPQPAPRDRSRRPADGRRVLRERARGRRPRQRSAGRPASVPPRLLRRLRHRSSRDEPGSCLPRSESNINVCCYLDGNNIEVVNHNRP